LPWYRLKRAIVGYDDFGPEDAAIFVEAALVIVSATSTWSGAHGAPYSCTLSVATTQGAPQALVKEAIATVLLEGGREWLITVGSLDLHFPYTVNTQCRYLAVNRNDNAKNNPVNEF